VWTLPVTLGCALIVIEPDIGTSSVVAVIAVAMLCVGGLSRKMLGRVALLGVVVFGAYVAYKPYSAGRLLSFLHPNTHLLGGGYQLLQSRIGLGAGGVGASASATAVRSGDSYPIRTPTSSSPSSARNSAHRTLLVIALFVAFLFAAVRIAQQCTNSVYRLVAVGITTWIAVEALINIASVVGWWAVTGIPLPFFSYGGTALITELAAVGLLYNIAHDSSHSGDVTIREHRITNFRETIERKSAPRPAARSRSMNDPRRTR